MMLTVLTQNLANSVLARRRVMGDSRFETPHQSWAPFAATCARMWYYSAANRKAAGWWRRPDMELEKVELK